jgi:hypothetical protein
MPRRPTRAGSGEREHPIGESVQGWLAQRGLAQRRLAATGLGPPAGGAPRDGDPALGPLVAIVACWAAVAGEELAGHARPVRVERGALVVAVDQPALVTELGFRANELLSGLAECAGRPVAEGLKVIVRGTLGLE